MWAAFLALWLQIRDGAPHSERQLMQVIEQYESDMGWTARAARELIRNAIDAYHTTRIDRHVAEFEVGRFEAAEAGIYAQRSAPGRPRQALALRRGPASRAQSDRHGLATDELGKAALSAARYIEFIEQGAIPCPCSQQDTQQHRRPTPA